MATILTAADLATAAQLIGCDVAALRAVDEVESSSRGFTKDNQVLIGFDSVNIATFKDYTGKKVSGSGQKAYEKAYQINPEKAMFSASWGRYQMQGYNFQACGFDTIESFVATMKTGEQAQLNAFVTCVNTRKIDDDLAKHDWDGFALVYNIRSGYAAKLARAYSKYEGEDTTSVVPKPYELESYEIGVADDPVYTVTGLKTRDLVLLILTSGLLLCVIIYAVRSPRLRTSDGSIR